MYAYYIIGIAFIIYTLVYLKKDQMIQHLIDIIIPNTIEL